MVYEWKKPLYKINPQEAGNYLEKIALRDGGISPSTIVKEARDEQALLHPCFEWDDTEAAQKYREDQARAVLRNIITITVTEKEPIKTRAFVHVVTQDNTGDKDSKYMDIVTVMNNPVMTSDLLKEAKRELASFKTKYKGILELAEIMDAIDRLYVV